VQVQELQQIVLDIPFARGADLLVIVVPALQVFSPKLQPRVLCDEVDQGLEGNDEQNDLDLVDDVLISASVYVSVSSFEYHVTESVIGVLKQVHADEQRQNEHVNTKTHKYSERYQSVLVSPQRIADTGHKGLNKGVEARVFDQNDDCDDDIVKLTELLEDDVILTDLVLVSRFWLVSYHVFFDVVWQLVYAVIPVGKESGPKTFRLVLVVAEAGKSTIYVVFDLGGRIWGEVEVLPSIVGLFLVSHSCVLGNHRRGGTPPARVGFSESFGDRVRVGIAGNSAVDVHLRETVVEESTIKLFVVIVIRY
jgi:hypothetical protein